MHSLASAHASFSGSATHKGCIMYIGGGVFLIIILIVLFLR